MLFSGDAEVMLHRNSRLIYLVPIPFFLAVSIWIIYFAFRDLPNDSFLFIGDHFLRFSFYETALNAFFIRRIESMGANNAWQFIVQFWDAVSFLILYKLGFGVLFSEVVIFFSSLFFTFIFSYIGFLLLFKMFFSRELSHGDLLKLTGVTLWYTLNPYTFTLWHGGVYNVGLTFTYGLLPATLGLILRVFLGKRDYITIIVLALLLFLSSFAFWLFAANIFILLTLIFLYFTFNLKQIRLVNVFSVVALISMYLPLASFVIYNMYFGFVNLQGYENPFTSPTFSNQQGGMLYQALMYFSWAIYTEWTPRTLYSFGSYFFSVPYLLSIGTLYSVLAVAAISMLRKRREIAVSKGFTVQRFLPVLVLAIVISIFFAKGAQPPLGNVFLYLYDKIPPFRVFRSADARFGLCVVFSVSLLMLYVSYALKPKMFFLFVVALVGIQSFTMFNGVALRGQNLSKGFIDRIVDVPKDYIEVSKFLNSTQGFSYVLSLPPLYYGQFYYDSNQIHIGQDMLPKLSIVPFLHTSMSTTGLYRDTYEYIVSALNSEDLSALKNLPVRYVLIRRDIVCASDCYEHIPAKLEQIGKIVFTNNTFDIYEVNPSASIVSGDVRESYFINPTKIGFSTDIRDLTSLNDSRELILNLSYSKHWEIYQVDSLDCEAEAAGNKCVDFFDLGDVKYLFKDAVGGLTQSKHLGYGNKWTSNENFVTNGSQNFVFFFLPQAYFYLFLIISFFTLCLLSTGLVCVTLYRSILRYRQAR